MAAFGSNPCHQESQERRSRRTEGSWLVLTLETSVTVEILSFGFSKTTGSESDTMNDKVLYQLINAVARQTESKACVCGIPLSFRIDQPLSNRCSHNPSPLESSNNNKVCVWICVMFMWLWLWLWLWMFVCCYCACGGCCCRGHGQCFHCLVCVFCGCCVSIVVCTCDCFGLEHNDFTAFVH